MAIGANGSCQFIFRTITGSSCVVDVNNDATTDDLITSIATIVNAPKDKIRLTLDCSLKIEGNAASEENAREVDTLIQKQFNTNIANFIKRTNPGIVIVKR